MSAPMPDVALLIQWLEGYAQASAALAAAVSAGDEPGMQRATATLADRTLALQQAMPRLAPALAQATPEVRAALRSLLEQASPAAAGGAELAGLLSAAYAGRAGALADAGQSALNYGATGRLNGPTNP